MTPLVLKARRLTLVCRWTAGVVVALAAVFAVLLRRGSADGQQFQVSDQVAIFLIGVLIGAGLLLLTRARVEADDQAVRVRNVLGERSFPWQVVVAVHLADGEPWAQLELHDDETVALFALQANDKDLAIDGVLALRRLLTASRTR